MDADEAYTEKKLNGNCTRMLQVILNKSWKQHPIKQQLYCHLSPITKTIKIRPTTKAGHFWGSKYELISDILQWTTSHERVSFGQTTRAYLQQLFTETGYSQRTCRKWWIIKMNGERESRKSVLAEWNHDTTASANAADIYHNRLIGLVGRVFANGLGDLSSISGRVIPKTLKMVLDTSLFNTQQYKVRIKGKVEQSRERSSPLGVVAFEKGAYWLPSATVVNFTFTLYIYIYIWFE